MALQLDFGVVLNICNSWNFYGVTIEQVATIAPNATCCIWHHIHIQNTCNFVPLCCNLTITTIMLLKCQYITIEGKNIMLMWFFIHLSWMKFVNVHYIPFAIERSFIAKKLKQLITNNSYV